MAEKSTRTRRHPNRLTIIDIAKSAGVSTATVSRVLNSPEQVNAETKQLVQSVIDKTGYVSDGIAMSLASNKSSTIGLVIPTITNSIYASSTQAIQEVAQKAGYTVLLGVSNFSLEEEERLIRQLLTRRVDGLILTGGDRPNALYQLIESNRVPYIVTWKLINDEATRPSVSFDNYMAGCLAMRHLTDLGHRRIGLICGRSDVNDRARERRRAYEDVLQQNGIDIDANLIFERDFEFVEGRAAMHRMLADPNPPTAVFCANDIQAIGALKECQSVGLNVPADVSIIGFDDLPVAQYTEPQLTTVRVPAKKMGHEAASKLIGWINRNETPGTTEFPVELVIRNTTARLA
ncbi:MAG: LacI family DNA-binding transcriptional regulator [Alphaproteobacteria bacterium]